MSQIKETIEISLPVTLQGGQSETLTSKPHRCPNCSGRGGWHYDEHDPRYKASGGFKMCRYCLGSGRVRAKITIQWEPDIPDVKSEIKYKNSIQILEDHLKKLASCQYTIDTNIDLKRLAEELREKFYK